MKNYNRRIWPFVLPPPKSPLILDNLGITFSLKSLEGWDVYRKAYRELFGAGWFSRFWRGRIYPIIDPKSYQERKQRFETERSRMQQQFLAVILEKGRELEDG